MSNPTLRVNKSVSSPPGFSSRKHTPDGRTESRRRRPMWRQRLVEAERGFSHSFRADSALHRHIFFDTLLVATCGVLGLPATHWAIVVSGLTAMLLSELMSLGLQTVAAELSAKTQKQVIAIGSAAKLLALLASATVIGIVLWLRIRELFGT